MHMTMQFAIQKTVQKSSPLYSESCAYDYVVCYPKFLHYIQNLVHMIVQFANKKTVQNFFPLYSKSCD